MASRHSSPEWWKSALKTGSLLGSLLCSLLCHTICGVVSFMVRDPAIFPANFARCFAHAQSTGSTRAKILAPKLLRSRRSAVRASWTTMAAANPEGKGYRHIERCVPGRGVRLDTGTTHGLYDGCPCREENCSSVECSCMCTCAYDSNGRLKIDYFATASKPVFECNSKCRCATTCPIRVTQNQPLTTLRVFETESKTKGYGVVCSHFLHRGTFVGEYVGQVISKSEVKRRLDKLTPSDPCYIVTYKEHLSRGPILTTNIDATHAGNITRFINHSCGPNLTMIPVRVDSIVPRLCLFACKDIESGTEMCFSYFGCSSVDILDKKAVVLGKKTCLCGSKHCLGFLPLQN